MQWLKIFDDTESSGNTIFQDQNVDILIIGDSQGGNTDGYLLKTDEFGNLLWSKTFAHGYGSGDGITGTSAVDCGYIIVGTDYEFQGGVSSVYLIKTDENGEEERTSILYETNEGIVRNFISQDHGGGYIVGVDTYRDFNLIKVDANGNTIWIHTIGSRSQYSRDRINQLDLASDNGYIMIGNIEGTPDEILSVYVYLVKLDANGQMLWERSYGRGYGFAVQQTSDKGFILTGQSLTRKDIGWERDVYLIKTDSLGNVEWERRYGGSRGDGGRDVLQNLDGQYAITGYFNGVTSTITSHSDVVLIMTTPDGN